MKFGCDLQFHGDFASTLDQAVYAEELGYDSVSVSEHHNSAGFVPQPLVALSAIATRTERIQLASSIAILPLYHPVVIAEQAAMVQYISGGRLACGVGLGYVPEEFDSFGVPYRERGGRMEEGLALLRRLWTETDVHHDGRYHRFSHATVHPRLQDLGTPPLWAGGWVERAIRRAARLADAWVPGAPVDLHTLRHCYALFRGELQRLGKPTAIEYPASRELFCAPTRQQAFETGGQALYELYKRTILRWPHPYLQEKERQMTLEELARDRFIVGDPEDCAVAVNQLRELGITQLSFRSQIPGVNPEDTAASLKLFMNEVAPRFR